MRDGEDIHVEADVRMDEAALGGTIRCRTVICLKRDHKHSLRVFSVPSYPLYGFWWFGSGDALTV